MTSSDSVSEKGRADRLTGWIASPYRRFFILYASMAEKDLFSLAGVMAGLVIGWWIYVPIHELLHAFGCLLAGGAVTELEIKAIYGGRILETIFPFVTTGGDYAGRLTGFDTLESDVAYAATILFPYLLTLGSMAGMEKSAEKGLPLLFGMTLPAFFAPIISIPGDYFESGSLLLYQVWPGPAENHRQFISDDIFRLIHEMLESTETVSGIGDAGFFIFAALMISVLLASLTLTAAYGIGYAFRN